MSEVLTGMVPLGDDVTLLREACQGCLDRADRLRAGAERAPDPRSRDELRALAQAEIDTANRIATLMGERRAEAPEIPQTPPCPARSHWARLVAQLERHRTAAQSYRELTTRLAQRAPEAAALFEQLSAAQMTASRRLRALIARADPQAIN